MNGPHIKVSSEIYHIVTWVKTIGHLDLLSSVKGSKWIETHGNLIKFLKDAHLSCQKWVKNSTSDFYGHKNVLLVFVLSTSIKFCI